MPTKPLADGDLRPDALRVVAVAGDGEEAGAVLVEQQEHRSARSRTGRPGPAPSWRPACRGRRPAPVATRARPARWGRPCRRPPPVAGSPRADGRAEGTSSMVEHPVDVGGPELEDLHHPAEGGEGVDVAAQPLEHRPAPLGALVHDGQPVLVVGHRIHQQHARPRVLGQVLHGLREELVRQRDSLVVDPVHPRQVRDVRRAVGRRGGDHRRDGAAEAALQLRQLHVEHARLVARPSARPRPRPGARAGRLVEHLLARSRRRPRSRPGKNRSNGLPGHVDR